MLREIVSLAGLGLYLIGVSTLAAPSVAASGFVGGVAMFLFGATILAIGISGL